MRKRNLILMACLFLFCLADSSEASAQCKDIRIPRGQISTTVKGVTAKKYACYRIRARAGKKSFCIWRPPISALSSACRRTITTRISPLKMCAIGKAKSAMWMLISSASAAGNLDQHTRSK